MFFWLNDAAGVNAWTDAPARDTSGLKKVGSGIFRAMSGTISAASSVWSTLVDILVFASCAMRMTWRSSQSSLDNWCGVTWPAFVGYAVEKWRAVKLHDQSQRQPQGVLFEISTQETRYDSSRETSSSATCKNKPEYPFEGRCNIPSTSQTLMSTTSIHCNSLNLPLFD